MTPEEVRADIGVGQRLSETMADDSDRAEGAASARELARRLEFWINFADT